MSRVKKRFLITSFGHQLDLFIIVYRMKIHVKFVENELG